MIIFFFYIFVFSSICLGSIVEEMKDFEVLLSPKLIRHNVYLRQYWERILQVGLLNGYVWFHVSTRTRHMGYPQLYEIHTLALIGGNPP